MVAQSTGLTRITASSCVDGNTLLSDTLSSKRNTKLKVLLTKLEALERRGEER